jgi:hypothetical protein
MELTADEYLHRSTELMHLAEQLMRDDPTLPALEAHFEAVGMLDDLLLYAAQWDEEQACERETVESWGSAFEEGT